MKISFAASRVGSSVCSASHVTPAPVRSARNRPGLPFSLASTRATVALSPSVTGSFTPFSRPPSTVALSVAALSAPGPSDVATQPMVSPVAIFGSSSAFWVSSPASITASARK